MCDRSAESRLTAIDGGIGRIAGAPRRRRERRGRQGNRGRDAATRFLADLLRKVDHTVDPRVDLSESIVDRRESGIHIVVVSPANPLGWSGQFARSDVISRSAAARSLNILAFASNLLTI